MTAPAGDPLFVGLDVGTSGVRALAIDGAHAVAGRGESPLPDSRRREPAAWWSAASAALRQLLRAITPDRVRALAVDGTSGTLLGLDRGSRPLGQALMYDDPIADTAILDAIAREAPAESAAHGPTSGLAKTIALQQREPPSRVLHQADWIAGQFTGRFDRSDENNALKTGYDPVARHWPDWIGRTGADADLLPRVVAPGAPLGEILPGVARDFGLPVHVLVVAGTTDGCASFLATGAAAPGDGVTALGSTLVLKLLSDRPLFAPEYGLYSHRLGDAWLAGGASNGGGAVLARFFDSERIAALSREIDPRTPSGLDYYPLLRPGERFPVSDPDFPPRLEPRPDSDARFLHGLLDGIAGIEARGYARLRELGAPALTSVRSVGGGASNAVWARIRRSRLRVPFLDPRSEEAAAGTARLARDAVLGTAGT